MRRDDIGTHARHLGGKTDLVLAFTTMYGVDEAFVGEANPIRDIVGVESK